MPQDLNESDMSMQAEPGATDNELVLGIADYPFIKDWADGNTYRLTVEVTQIAPGRFRVDTATPEAVAAEAEGPALEEEAGYEQPTNSANYPNPAVARMMAKR